MGTVEGIWLAADPAGSPQPREQARFLAGLGPVGDRNFRLEGGPIRADGDESCDLTLIEAEALEALAAETAIELSAAASRRNLLTRGIRLNGLVGKRFRVGEVVAVGAEPCHPCRYLERLTQPGVLKGLARRGGLRADVLESGDVAVGDAIALLD